LDSWTNEFKYKEEVDEEHPGLRKPQLGALHALLGHFLSPTDIATVVLPTGTGKTETMLSAMIAGKCRKLLVTVPSSALRNQMFGKFKTLGVLKDPKFGVVGDGALYPIVGVVNSAFDTVEELNSFIAQCNVVITTMQIIDAAPHDQQDVYVSAFTNVFVDEAHHIVAESWRKFADRFPKNQLIQFTATPFRNDGQRLEGKVIFNYPLK
jgi:superfamily II DNA or RNA helicase